MDTALETPRRVGAVLPCDRESVPIDRSILAEFSGGNQSIEIRMLRAFRRSNVTDTAALNEAIGRQDLVAVARVAHRLMGAGRIAGALALATICEELEQAARAGNRSGVAAISAACCRELERVNTYLSTVDDI